MINALDRYILRKIIGITVAMVGVALIALMLERMLRLLTLAAHPDQILSYLSKLLITLIPHYLGVAVPIAFFLGVIIAFNRLSRDKELQVMTAAGISLQRLMAPVLGLALLLALFVAITVGYLQPVGRYTYRSLVHIVAQATLSAAVREGIFINVDDLTFIAERTSADGEQLDRVFIFDERPGGSTFVTTAKEGSLRNAPDSYDSILVLGDGRRTEFKADHGGARTLRFGHFTWPITTTADMVFRKRGADERELTLPELWAAQSAPPKRSTAEAVVSELHARLVKIVTVLVLPLLAVPLALGGGRIGQSYGIGLGLFILFLFEKTLKFGQSMVELGRLSPWPGLWLPLAVFTLLGFALTYRAGFKVPKGTLAVLPSPIQMMTWLWRRLGGARRGSAA